MKKLYAFILFTSIMLGITGCTDAHVASRNLSKSAEMFELERRVIFYNGITGQYMLVIEGKCSVEKSNSSLAVTCKVGNDTYKKHYLGLSDNVTFFSEQLESKKVDVYHYRVIFKPSVIIPDIDVRL